ncbi:MAG: autorepressor SdpR family transcription factor [Parvularcula sp.]|jgi:DNA-binding transcriptional ArsR family regulator|nr:autorepressor SdpR family transcription factor [Parvularcula sp.]
MASIFKALADPTRRTILELLRDGPLSAGEVAENFPFSKPTLSGHLNVLREAGLVRSEKQGQKVIYHLEVSVLEDAILSFAQQFGIGVGKTAAEPDNQIRTKGVPS